MKKLSVPGIHHRVNIRIVSPRTFYRYFPEKLGKGEDLKGYFIHSTNTIFLRSNLDEFELLHTLGHEWAHSILYQSGISHTNEESICDALGSFLIKIKGLKSLGDIE